MKKRFMWLQDMRKCKTSITSSSFDHHRAAVDSRSYSKTLILEAFSVTQVEGSRLVLHGELSLDARERPLLSGGCRLRFASGGGAGGSSAMFNAVCAKVGSSKMK